MPRPLKKPPTRAPGDVIVRREGGAELVEVVTHDELIRRKEEAEWRRITQRRGWDLRELHALLALQLGDPIVAPDYTGTLWWFVRDVNGLDRTITVGTLIYEQPFERTFPFGWVEPYRAWHLGEVNEIALAYAKVQQRLGPFRVPRCHASAA